MKLVIGCTPGTYKVGNGTLTGHGLKEVADLAKVVMSKVTAYRTVHVFSTSSGQDLQTAEEIRSVLASTGEHQLIGVLELPAPLERNGRLVGQVGEKQELMLHEQDDGNVEVQIFVSSPEVRRGVLSAVTMRRFGKPLFHYSEQTASALILDVETGGLTQLSRAQCI